MKLGQIVPKLFRARFEIVWDVGRIISPTFQMYFEIGALRTGSERGHDRRPSRAVSPRVGEPWQGKAPPEASFAPAGAATLQHRCNPVGVPSRCFQCGAARIKLQERSNVAGLPGGSTSALAGLPRGGTRSRSSASATIRPRHAGLDFKLDGRNQRTCPSPKWRTGFSPGTSGRPEDSDAILLREYQEIKSVQM